MSGGSMRARCSSLPKTTTGCSPKMLMWIAEAPEKAGVVVRGGLDPKDALGEAPEGVTEEAEREETADLGATGLADHEGDGAHARLLRRWLPVRHDETGKRGGDDIDDRAGAKPGTSERPRPLMGVVARARRGHTRGGLRAT